MDLLRRLKFSSACVLPIFYQTENSECGLACIAMISCYHGHHIELSKLRLNLGIGSRGATLNSLIKVSQSIGLAARALKVPSEKVEFLRLPAIVHWNDNHFLVLKKINLGHVIVHDPALGVRKISRKEFFSGFTEVALELLPDVGFVKTDKSKPVGVFELMGKVSGIKRSILQILIIAAALEVFLIVQPLYMQSVVDKVVIAGDADLLSVLAIFFIGLAIFQNLANLARSQMIMYLSSIVSIQWKVNLFSHMLRLPVSFYENRQLGDVISRFKSVDSIKNTITATSLEVVIDGLMAIFIFTLMIFYGRALIWVTVISTIFYIMGRLIWFGSFKANNEMKLHASAKLESGLIETIRGSKTIKIFNAEEKRLASWTTLLVDDINSSFRVDRAQNIYRQLNLTLFLVEKIVVTWWAVHFVLQSRMSLGIFVAYFSYRELFVHRVTALIDKLFEFRMLSLQTERLSDIAQAKGESNISGDYKAFDGNSHSYSLAFRDVYFSYSSMSKPILKCASFQIEDGESVAIIGASGAGKTTLLNLLLGIHCPTNGSIFVAGKNYTEIGNKALRSIIGCVSQDDMLFAGTILQNISFFDDHVDKHWAKECASIAAIHYDILSMPMGYDTFLGEMGAGLSGGQKQRILLARALYKKPKIILLDEATSNLDVECERLVSNAIGALRVTRIFIAHRPETIRSAERVLKLEDGMISEVSHESVGLSRESMGWTPPS